MKRSTHWLVADHGIRPKGHPDRCFYCDTEMGKDHAEGCVIRKRTVVVRFQVDLVVAVPEEWTADEINLRYNESSWCANNLVSDMTETVDRIGENGCLCGVFEAEFVREANENDETIQRLRVNELPS